jgi:hypothetical protein
MIPKLKTNAIIKSTITTPNKTHALGLNWSVIYLGVAVGVAVAFTVI